MPEDIVVQGAGFHVSKIKDGQESASVKKGDNTAEYAGVCEYVDPLTSTPCGYRTDSPDQAVCYHPSSAFHLVETHHEREHRG